MAKHIVSVPASDKKKISVSVPDLEDIVSPKEEIAEAIKEAARQKRYFDGIGNKMADWVANLLELYSKNRTERELLAHKIREYEEVFAKHLVPQMHPDPDDGRLPYPIWKARLAYAEAMIASTTTRDSLSDIIEGSKFYKNLPGLIQLGVMERVGQVAKAAVIVQIFTETYKLNGSRGEACRLKELLETTADRIKVANRANYAKDKTFKMQYVTIPDSRRIYMGSPGFALIHVPIGHLGGDMVVESNGENLKVFVAIGNKEFQEIMQEIADAQISIPISSLREERFVYKKGLSEQDNYYCQVLHNMLRRGKAALDENDVRQSRVKEYQAKADTERTTFKVKANISNYDWLQKSGNGTALIYLGRKPWIVKKGDQEEKYYEVFFLIERSKNGDIRIPEYPSHLKGLFGDTFADWFSSGERYENTKYPLSAILKTAYAYSKAKAVEQADHEATRKWVEEDKAKTQPIPAS